MKRSFICIVVLVVVFWACGKSGGSSTSVSNNGKDSILTNLGNSIILPAYTGLEVSVVSLDSAITDFNSSPTADKLTALQGFFKTAYFNWQYVSAYDGFGPAAANQPLLQSINLFPVNTTTVETNITNGSYSVNAFTNAAAKGFPALDYFLFGAGSNTLSGFTTATTAANRKLYLAAVSSDIKAEVDASFKGWQASGGNYISTFVNGTGNSISSSLGLLINSLDQDFEILKNDKLGIPLGKQPPGQSLPILPQEVEAYYSGISAQLATAQLKAAQAIFLGTTGSGSGASGNGLGLRNYLINANAKYNGGLLADTITVAFASAVQGMNAIADPFSATIQSNSAPAVAVYNTVQKLVVLLKTDMPSSLGVLITYGDNDGD